MLPTPPVRETHHALLRVDALDVETTIRQVLPAGTNGRVLVPDLLGTLRAMSLADPACGLLDPRRPARIRLEVLGLVSASHCTLCSL